MGSNEIHPLKVSNFGMNVIVSHEYFFKTIFIVVFGDFIEGQKKRSSNILKNLFCYSINWNFINFEILILKFILHLHLIHLRHERPNSLSSSYLTLYYLFPLIIKNSKIHSICLSLLLDFFKLFPTTLQTSSFSLFFCLSSTVD